MASKPSSGANNSANNSTAIRIDTSIDNSTNADINANTHTDANSTMLTHTMPANPRSRMVRWGLGAVDFIKSYILVILILLVWQLSIYFGVVPDYLLPSPVQIVKAFIDDFPLLMQHAKYTLATAFIGIAIGLVISFILSICMDVSKTFKALVYPIILLNQTIPTIAIAPLLIIWLGYGMTPKIVLVVLAVFFPITIALIDGYQSVSRDHLNLFKSMQATRYQIYRHLKIPSAMGFFFTGLKVALSYALISAVIAEWLGGYYGLGVYMTRVRKSYDLDSMFAVIFLISFLTFLLIGLVKWLEGRMVKET